jgi:hypothetical protein
MKISVTISERGIMRVTYPNGETHAYQIREGWKDTVDHHVRDTLADLMVRFMMDRTIDLLALVPAGAEPMANVTHIHRVPKPTYTWEGLRVNSLGPDTADYWWNNGEGREVKGAGGLQLEGAGGLQLEGAGGLQLSIPARTAIGIYQTVAHDSNATVWVVSFDDNSVLETTDACAARAWAEEIYCAKPKKE